MSILSTSKVLVCIYTCKQDTESVSELKETEWFKDISSRSNFQCIEVLADEKIDQQHILDNKVLTLKLNHNMDMPSLYYPRSVTIAMTKGLKHKSRP